MSEAAAGLLLAAVEVTATLSRIMLGIAADRRDPLLLVAGTLFVSVGAE
jgi:hypothetical protein